jgi:hypothetical protein
LLTPADLSTGWVKRQRGESLIRGVTALCGQQLAAGGEVASPVWTGLQAGPNADPVVGESLGSFASSEAAESVVAGAQHASTSCGSFTSGGVRLRISPLTFPTIGDYSFAISLRHSGTYIDVLFSETGSTVLALAVAGSRSIHPAAFRQLARLAEQQLNAA